MIRTIVNDRFTTTFTININPHLMPVQLLEKILELIKMHPRHLIIFVLALAFLVLTCTLFISATNGGIHTTIINY